MPESIFCLDPSCFTSLEKLRDTKHFLNEIGKDNPSLRVYIPTKIYEVITYPPEKKFRELPPLIDDWIEKEEQNNIKSMDSRAKEEYVFVMREFLELHSPIPTKELVSDIRKIGEESLYLDDLIKKFGGIRGKIMFEMAAISNEFSSKILAFGRKTTSFFESIGTRIIIGKSEVKKQIKTRAGIRRSLDVIMYFVVPSERIYTFIQEFQIQGIEALLDPNFLLAASPVAWYVIANS